MATKIKIPMQYPVTLLCSLLLGKSTHMHTKYYISSRIQQKFRRDNAVIYLESHGITVLLYVCGMTKFASCCLGKLLGVNKDACEKEASVSLNQAMCFGFLLIQGWGAVIIGM